MLWWGGARGKRVLGVGGSRLGMADLYLICPSARPYFFLQNKKKKMDQMKNIYNLHSILVTTRDTAA